MIAMGDVATESLDRILAGLHYVDLQPIHELIEDAAASQWARGAAVRARQESVFSDQLSRDDAVRETSWWACFDQKGRRRDRLPADLQPIRRTEPKIGRNAPCPCGSGKKYKKCCGSGAGNSPTPG